MLGISNEAVIGLLKGATEVLSRMPHVMITQGVLGICSLQSRHLAQVVQHTLFWRVQIVCRLRSDLPSPPDPPARVPQGAARFNL